MQQGCRSIHDPVAAGIPDEVSFLPLYLRGDSGFASPDLYDACEEYDCKYAIRLKINKTLLVLAQDKADGLHRATRNNMVDYAVTYGEFACQAGTWAYPAEWYSR